MKDKAVSSVDDGAPQTFIYNLGCWIDYELACKYLKSEESVEIYREWREISEDEVVKQSE